MDNEPPDTFANRCQSFWKNHWGGVIALIIPLAFLPIIFIDFQSKIYRFGYLYCIMAAYWFTKVVPSYITGLLPVLLLPPMGVLDSNTVCMLYFSDVIGLFLGAMLMSLAMEYSGLSKRIAFKMLSTIGNSPRRILWTLVFTTMLLSMWISNTAATALMCTVASAIVDDLDAQGVIKAYEEQKNADDKPKASATSSCFFLSVAFAATIGGTGTLLGTSTNLALKGIYDERFVKSNVEINFSMFIAYTLPMVILLTIFLCVWMQLLFLRNIDATKLGRKLAEDEKSAVRTKYNELGPLTCHEIQVIILFIILILLLITLRPVFINGWADVLNEKAISYSLPAIAIGLLLFILPMRYTFCKYCCGKAPYTNKEVPSIITFKYVAKNLPWGYIFLIGAGIALTKGISESGTDKWLIQKLGFFTNTPLWFVQLFCIIFTVLVTTLTYNIIAANLVIPIVFELAIAIGVHPLYLVLPTGLAASYAFLIPFSTPPNELVFKYGNIRKKQMFLAGLGPTIAAILFVFANGNSWHWVLYPDVWPA